MRIANVLRTLGAIAKIIGYRLSQRSFRSTELKPVRLNYKHTEVTIKRTSRGVPSIASESEAAWYYGQGYCAARDRMWQMDLLRRYAKGQLSEVLGESFWEMDRYHAALAIREMASDSLELLSVEDRELLVAYCEGINQFLQQTRSQKRLLGIEFRLLEYLPDRWTAIDTLAVLKFTSLQLSTNVRNKAFLSELAKSTDRDLLELFASTLGRTEFCTLTGKQVRLSDKEFSVEPKVKNYDWKPLLRVCGQMTTPGSNAWVVGKPKSNNAILANDPHLGFSVPSLFHAVEFTRASEAEPCVYGCSVPGVPGFISGNNKHISWGITNSYVDVQDIALGVKTNTSESYFTPRKFLRKIKVKNQISRDVNVELTPYGPALNSIVPSKTDSEKVILAWSGLIPARDMQGLFALPKSANWQMFKRSLKEIQSLSLNFFYADKLGNIGMKTSGFVPVRVSGSHQMASPSVSWKGSIPFEELPELYNPSSGYILNANNRLNSEEYPYYLANLWCSDYRARRIDELLKSKENIGLEECRNVQDDILNIRAREILPKLLPYLRNAVRTDDVLCQLCELLETWDYHDAHDQAAPYIWHQFVASLSSSIFEIIPQQIRPYLENRDLVLDQIIAEYLSGKSHIGLVDRSFDQLLSGALSDVLEKGVEKYSPDFDRWRWGRNNQLEIKHPLSSSLGVLRKYFDLPAVERSGSNETISLSHSSRKYGKIIEGAIWKFVSYFPESKNVKYSVLVPGVSGDFRSQWYGNQLE